MVIYHDSGTYEAEQVIPGVAAFIGTGDTYAEAVQDCLETLAAWQLF